MQVSGLCVLPTHHQSVSISDWSRLYTPSWLLHQLFTILALGINILPEGSDHEQTAETFNRLRLNITNMSPVTTCDLWSDFIHRFRRRKPETHSYYSLHYSPGRNVPHIPSPVPVWDVSDILITWLANKTYNWTGGEMMKEAALQKLFCYSTTLHLSLHSDGELQTAGGEPSVVVCFLLHAEMFFCSPWL